MKKRRNEQKKGSIAHGVEEARLAAKEVVPVVLAIRR
jgi:hypothetical protein